MQVVMKPLINVEAALADVREFGHETVVLELNVGKKLASITMTRTEAKALLDGLRAVGVGGISVGSVVLPRR